MPYMSVLMDCTSLTGILMLTLLIWTTSNSLEQSWPRLYVMVSITQLCICMITHYSMLQDNYTEVYQIFFESSTEPQYY